jgi:peptidoglycan hydrolase-like protein with peptidoglycan-binding domain
MSSTAPNIPRRQQEFQKQLIRAAVESGMSETEANEAFRRGQLQRLCQYDSGVSLTDLEDDYQRGVFRVQQALCSVGFDPGPITGRLTATTRQTYQDTIRRFQREYGLEETGREDRLTLRALGFPASEVDAVAEALERRGRERLGPDLGTGTLLPVVAVLAAGGALAFVAATLIKR